MISELGERHVTRMQEQLAGFNEGTVPLRKILVDIEALIGLLSDEATLEWVDLLQAEFNRADLLYSASRQDEREPTEQEVGEIRHALSGLQRILRRTP